MMWQLIFFPLEDAVAVPPLAATFFSAEVINQIFQSFSSFCSNSFQSGRQARRRLIVAMTDVEHAHLYCVYVMLLWKCFRWHVHMSTDKLPAYSPHFSAQNRQILASTSALAFETPQFPHRSYAEIATVFQTGFMYFASNYSWSFYDGEWQENWVTTDMKRETAGPF